MSFMMRYTQKVSVRALIYILPLPALALYGLCLTGCVSTSPGVPNISLVQIADGQQNSLRLGYYGICDETNHDDIGCTPTPGKSAEEIATRLRGRGNSTIPTDLIALGLDIQGRIFISPFSVSGVLFALGVISACLHKLRNKKQHEKSMTGNEFTSVGSAAAGTTDWLQLFAVGFCWLASSSAFTTAFSMTETTNGLQYISKLEAGGIYISSGLVLQRMHWATFALAFLFSLGLTSMLKAPNNNSSDASGASGMSNFGLGQSGSGSGGGIVVV